MDSVEDAGRDVAGFGEDLKSGESSCLGVGLGSANRVGWRRIAVGEAGDDESGERVLWWPGSAKLQPDTRGQQLGGGKVSRVDRHARAASGIYTLNITRLSREVTSRDATVRGVLLRPPRNSGQGSYGKPFSGQRIRREEIVKHRLYPDAICERVPDVKRSGVRHPKARQSRGNVTCVTNLDRPIIPSLNHVTEHGSGDGAPTVGLGEPPLDGRPYHRMQIGVTHNAPGVIFCHTEDTPAPPESQRILQRSPVRLTASRAGTVLALVYGETQR